MHCAQQHACNLADICALNPAKLAAEVVAASCCIMLCGSLTKREVMGC